MNLFIVVSSFFFAFCTGEEWSEVRTYDFCNFLQNARPINEGIYGLRFAEINLHKMILMNQSLDSIDTFTTHERREKLCHLSKQRQAMLQHCPNDREATADKITAVICTADAAKAHNDLADCFRLTRTKAESSCAKIDSRMNELYEEARSLGPDSGLDPDAIMARAIQLLQDFSETGDEQFRCYEKLMTNQIFCEPNAIHQLARVYNAFVSSLRSDPADQVMQKWKRAFEEREKKWEKVKGKKFEDMGVHRDFEL